jgi:hypothetical protein
MESVEIAVQLHATKFQYLDDTAILQYKFSTLKLRNTQGYLYALVLALPNLKGL